MKCLGTKTKANLMEIIDALGIGSGELGVSGKINNSEGSFMAVHGEWFEPNFLSIAHYWESGGDLMADLMADPEMVFWKGLDGEFYPVYFRQDGAVPVVQKGLYFNEGQKPVRWCKTFMAEQVEFAGLWFKNIRSQQGL